MALPTTEPTFLRLSAAETMLALPSAGVVDIPWPDPRGGPREVLERILRDALTDTPCYVLFSGGRDSSALLALATHVARREGLPLPVPVTARYPEAPGTDETSWQELVLEHLRLPGHVVLEVRGEERLLSDVATGALRRHGVLWPEAVQLHGGRYRHLGAGAVISGEGGDMVVNGHRMAALRAALAMHRPRRRTLRAGVRAALPASVTRALVAQRVAAAVPPWLRPPMADHYVEHVTVMQTDPLRWDVATRQSIRKRYMDLLFTNFAASISEYGARSVNPFVSPEFVESLARAGGARGWGDRTDIFRRLFGDVLPDAVLSRRSKAAFNATRWGPDERDFARSYDGAGLDEAVIDIERLRAEWLSDDPHPAADFLLHVAWAASEGLPVAGLPPGPAA
ncbi:asparagine synthase C-terminal domain-containing protein [Georgenia phoenicis]|uniref:asparagine synthase-related protein n=1 Tax=unclassified Georgenia TaxID=2626815 RepID=UPI0039B0A8AA